MLSISPAYTGMRLYPLSLTTPRTLATDIVRGTATTSTLGFMISRTFRSCRFSTPLIISCSE